MSELGKLLKNTREAKKKTIRDVVDDTRIREPFIIMLEEGEFGKLPSYIHAYGFVKKYSEFLGLDYENEVWPLFSTECPKDGESNQNILQEEIAPEDYTTQTTETSFIKNETKKSKTGLYITFAVLFLCIVGYAGYYSYSNNYFDNLLNQRSVEAVVTNNTPPVVVTEEAVVFSEDNKSDNNSYFNYYGSSIYNDNNSDNLSSEAPNTAEPAFVDPLFAQNIPTPVTIESEKVKVSFSENCWFKYKTDKGEEDTIDAKQGTTLTLEFDKTFRVEIGNAVAVSLEYNGQTYSNFGRRNIVRILNYEAVNGKLELVTR